MMKIKHLIILSGMAIFASCSPKNKIVYPDAMKENSSDNYFGTEVSDPYRWLENDTSQATAEWVKAENEITYAYLNKIPFRNNLKKRLTELADYEKISAPMKKHNKYYFFKNDGLQNQSVLYVKESLEGEATVLLDPNQLSADGTTSLNGIYFSNDGNYMVYSISHSGSDWAELFVIDLATRQQTKDHIKWVKFSGASWHGDGFYYSSYDAPTEGKEYSNINENHKIYYHKLGESQSNDKLIYQNPDQPKRFYRVYTSEDERILYLFESGEDRGNAMYIKDLTKENASFIPIATDMKYRYYPIENIGNKIYIYTNYHSPKYKIIQTDLNNPKLSNWKDLIPENESVLSTAQVIGEKLFVIYEKDAANHAYLYSLTGELEHEISLPSLGSVSFNGDKKDKEVFYSFTSFTFPGTVYRYDMEKNVSTLYQTPKVDFNPEGFTTEQVFYPSKDGTLIPMFLTYQKGLERDGNNPVYLYGYGGFNISLNPSFSTYRLPFLENGGIYAQVNLRGGGEYGEEWHLAGTKMNKQNVFDDFISAAEYLIKENFTNPDKIAIAGGSNGGLLVGACVNQRPDLFKVAIPEVGVMDMLRYHKFTIGWNWASDYGTSEDSEEMFEYLYAYSPLHNIKNDGTTYPAILVTTADHDDRVVPAHSFKYAATLQASDTGDAPKLIRIETNAGHGSGKPISKILEEQSDKYSFVMYNLGMTPKF